MISLLVIFFQLFASKGRIPIPAATLKKNSLLCSMFSQYPFGLCVVVGILMGNPTLQEGNVCNNNHDNIVDNALRQTRVAWLSFFPRIYNGFPIEVRSNSEEGR